MAESKQCGRKPVEYPTDGGVAATIRDLPAGRPAMYRLYVIDCWLREKRRYNTQRMAEELEVSGRTIQRDVEYMRDMFGAPIEHDPELNCFVYSEPGFVLPAMRMSEGELVSIFIAERVMRQYRGTPFEQRIRSAFDKICRFLPDEISIDVRQLDEMISFNTTAVTVHDLDNFNALARATLERRRLKMRYYTMSRDDVNERLIDPYHLANINGNWYLFAHCHLRGEVRVFCPTRVKQLETTNQSFTRPENFAIGEFLKDTFSIIKGERGEGLQSVELRFSGDVARYVRERVWHPSQELVEGDDGSLVLSMQLETLDEIKRWVLSWGADVTVLEPESLRQWIVRELLRMIQDHALIPTVRPRAAKPKKQAPKAG